MGNVLLHILPSIALGFLIQLLIHEIGHFIGGKLTGWRLLYLQIFNIVIYKSKNKLKLKSVSYTACQCIMYPKTINQRALLYTMGGCIINLIAASISMLLMIMAQDPIAWLYAWCFFVFGAVLFLINGISSVKQICNDKACYNLLKSDKHTLVCHNSQLLIAKHLFDGMTYRQFGEESICLCPEVAENDIEAYQAVLESYYHMDRGDYPMAEKALRKVKEGPQISRGVYDIVCLERVYIDILNRINISPDLSKYVNQYVNHYEYANNNLRELLKLHGRIGDLHSMRVEILFEAYETLNIGDRKRAAMVIKEAITSMRQMKCIYEGEKAFCIHEFQRMLKSLEEDTIRIA